MIPLRFVCVVRRLVGWGARLALLAMLLEGCKRPPFVPTSRYSVHEVEGFRIAVSPALASEGSEAETSVATLRAKLIEFRAHVQPETFEALRVVPIWIERGPCPERAMAGYHGAEWVRAHALNPDKARSIEIADHREFFRALAAPSQMALAHELAHAYYDRIVKDHRPIRAAYEAALRSHTYDNVRRRAGDQGRAYAMESSAEYFAELTEAYLGSNDQEPVDRAELRTFDPEGFRQMQAAWGP